MLTWAERQDPVRWRNLLARLVPLMIPPYLLAVAFVNDLLSPQWRRMSEALTAFDEFGLLPFYHHYIVSKAQAAVLSFGVELGRWFKPGLQPDFSNVIIAAAAAGIAAKLTPAFWSILEGETFAKPTAPVRGPVRSPAIAAARRTQPRSRADDLKRPETTLAGLVTAAVCLAATAAVVATYPLAPWALGIALMVYAAALSRWPGLWLLVIPAVLPALDLTPWTGWTRVGSRICSCSSRSRSWRCEPRGAALISGSRVSRLLWWCSPSSAIC